MKTITIVCFCYLISQFGERLKLALKLAGYTQKSETEELELSKNAVTNYVAGRITDAINKEETNASIFLQIHHFPLIFFAI